MGTLTDNGGLEGGLRNTITSQSLRGMAVSMLSAGITQGLATQWGIEIKPESWSQVMEATALKTAVSTTLDATIDGTPVDEAFLNGLRSGAVDAIGAYVAKEIGNLYQHGYGEINSLTHKLCHAMLGAGMGAATSEDAMHGMVTGALTGMFVEIIGDYLSNDMIDQAADPNNTKTFEDFAKSQDRSIMAMKFASGLVALGFGGDVNAAAKVAENALENNNYAKILRIIGPLLLEAATSPPAKRVLTKKTTEQLAKIARDKAVREAVKNAYNSSTTSGGSPQGEDPDGKDKERAKKKANQQELLKKFEKLEGNNPRKIERDGARTRANTDMKGGIQKAQEVFEKLTGRNLDASQVAKEHLGPRFEVRFRLEGKSGHPKIEITDLVRNTIEKITFID